jgi:hypothetical protein
MKHLLFLTLASSVFVSAHARTQASDCRDWKACRQLALDAAERRDFDQFHDLAWRAVNLGPRNEPALMTLVARAQSLSGRPHDALVMLNRLAVLNVVTDAATSDDFANVRALPGWAELEAKIAGKAPPPPAAVVPPPADPPALAPPPRKATRGTKPAGAKTPDAPPAALRFATSALPSSVGLAYDAVSGRFIIGDRQDRRLLVIGERSGRLSSLAGIDAGFNDIAAFEIDALEGDLWVVSTTASRTSTVHKLQLVSGRVLFSIELPAEQGVSRFTDVAITPQSVLLLDSEGRRIFRLAKKGKSLDAAARLPAPAMSSLAPGPDGVAFVAYDAGVARIDLAGRALTVVEPGQRADVSGLTWIRWHRGSLIGIQRSADAHQLVRIRLDEAGRAAKSVEPFENARVAGPTSATLVGNTIHYLSQADTAGQLEIRKITLK